MEGKRRSPLCRRARCSVMCDQDGAVPTLFWGNLQFWLHWLKREARFLLDDLLGFDASRKKKEKKGRKTALFLFFRIMAVHSEQVLATDQNEAGVVIFCACRPSGGLIPACYCILHHVQKSFCNSLSLPGYDHLWKWLSVGLRVWKKCTNALMRNKGGQRLRNFLFFLFFFLSAAVYTPIQPSILQSKN